MITTDDVNAILASLGAGTMWQVWYRKPGETTWREFATYPFQRQAEITCQRIVARFGEEAKFEAVPRA
jgi:hypothetical protein